MSRPAGMTIATPQVSDWIVQISFGLPGLSGSSGSFRQIRVAPSYCNTRVDLSKGPFSTVMSKTVPRTPMVAVGVLIA